jgi:hypothetical protein
MRKISALPALALATIAVSCQEGGDNPPPEPTSRRVVISPAITLPTNSSITRATELSFEAGDEIGGTITKEDGTVHAKNAPMSYRDGVFVGDTDWYDGTAASKIVAYYPWSATGVPTAFSVATEQTTGYATSDLMGAVRADAAPSNSPVSMTFRHLMAKLLINVIQTDEDIRSVVLQNSIPAATIDAANLTVSAIPTAPAADIIAQQVTRNSLYRAIVVPQKVALSIVVTTTAGKTYTHKLTSAEINGGEQYNANVKIADGKIDVSLSGEIVNWTDGDRLEEWIDPNPPGATAYITKVLDFMPAVGQFTNQIPYCGEGDTQKMMNDRVLKILGNGKKGMITLGGWGGYVVVGFDHTIANVAGKRDFRVLGNAFYAADNPDPDAPLGGSCEPAVIAVAYDVNKNGLPDEDEWYEIGGSAHLDPTGEPWYAKAVAAGNDVNLYRDYEMTYYRPAKEPESPDGWATYIRWTDNRGNSGYKVKNEYHSQPYYPIFAGDKITFRGTRLPENGIDESGQGNYYVLYKFRYGYADNAPNNEEGSAIDIDWAIDGRGQKVRLPGVDFIKVYTGVDQENGWLGECSTEFMGIEDLHVLGIDINTRN